MSDAGAPAGLLVELRQKTVQLLEAIDSGADSARGEDRCPICGVPLTSPAEAHDVDAHLDASARGEDHEAGIEAIPYPATETQFVEARGEDHEENENRYIVWLCPDCGWQRERNPTYVSESCLRCGSHAPSVDRLAYLSRSSPVDDTARDEDHEADFTPEQAKRAAEMARGGGVMRRRPVSSPVDDTVRLREFARAISAVLNREPRFQSDPVDYMTCERVALAALSVDAGKPEA